LEKNHKGGKKMWGLQFQSLLLLRLWWLQNKTILLVHGNYREMLPVKVHGVAGIKGESLVVDH